jgi:hypothetical protein
MILKMVPSTSMWFPFLNWFVVMMFDQPFLEPSLVWFRGSRRRCWIAESPTSSKEATALDPMCLPAL